MRSIEPTRRTGSYILVHGGCKSIGCYAMTNPVIEEIFSLSEQALRQGQDRIQVQAFPFRMTEDNLKAVAGRPWHGFWQNLKEAYDAFERTRIPPKVAVCDKRYVVSESASRRSRQALRHGMRSPTARGTRWRPRSGSFR